MIIDVHRHMVVKGTVQGDYIRGAQKSFTMMYRKTHKVQITDKEFTDNVVRPLIDPNGDNIVAEMDKAGVDKSVIFGVDYGLVYGEPPMNIFDTNKHYAKAAQRHPDRFIPFVEAAFSHENRGRNAAPKEKNATMPGAFISCTPRAANWNSRRGTPWRPHRTRFEGSPG